jgi:Domain of unknown function (DUF4190)
MKKCPTCDKEYPDSMRFCQTDGTVLVEAAPPADPYKTIVSNQMDVSAAIPPSDPFKSSSAPKSDDDDLLQLPDEPDLLKTMVVSREELKAAADSEKAEDVAPLDLPPSAPYTPSAPLIEPKPKAQSDSMPTPPKANEPLPSPPDFGNLPAPKFDAPKPETAASTDATAIFDQPSMPENPPSPFDSKPFENDFSKQSPYGNQENKPIPSPFDLSMPPGYLPPSMSPFENEPKPPVKDFPAPSPFDPPTPFGQPDPFNNQPLQQAEWTPPPAPDANWQNQNIGANTPFQPPVAGQGLNQTLPIISLVLGIVSLCCYVSPLTGIAALITGYLGLKNVNTDPNQYGGKTLAIIGMVLGGIFLLVGVLYWIYIIFIIGLAASGGFR